MPTLIELFPSPKDLLDAQPEDLGGVLLELGPEVMKRYGHLSISIYAEQLFRVVDPTYPQQSRADVVVALAEALAWLCSQGLMMVDPNQSHGQTLIVTRRGKRLRTKVDVETYRKGSLLPLDLLHPEISTTVHPIFLRGDYDVAVAQAYRKVEIALRNAANAKGAGYPNDLVGTKLVHAALNKDNGPLRNLTATDAERVGEASLFSGAVLYARNPTSHRDVLLTPREAAQLILFASHLYEIVERRA
jgi:hypothetical protein